MESELLDEKLSRRGLIKGAAGAVGIAALTMGGLGILSKAEAAKTNPSKLPWPYKKFTPAEIKQAGDIAHDNWFKGFCSYAALSGIVEMLRKKVGGPYNSFPMELTTFAHGGTSGWGGTCGTLIGAGVASTLAAGPKIGEAINNEVMNYYANTALPVFVPSHPKAELKTQNISNSPLCHLSVGKWMKKEGVGFLSHQQMERCARVSSDMAMKTLELLNLWADGKFDNLWADGKFEPTTTAPVAANEIPSQNNCTECHTTEIPKTSGPFATGVDLLKSGH
jgi:hypothetical protein